MVAAICVALFIWLCGNAQQTSPSPTAEVVEYNEGFPTVDWDYWESVNRNVIGWITIPGTNVNAPVLQAHSDNPNYYLWHDVYGNYNVYGAIYLDSDCEEKGLSSRNAVICGHSARSDYNNCPFGVVQEYKNLDFAQAHTKVLLQTREQRWSLDVAYATIIDGNILSKVVTFGSKEAFESYYDNLKSDAIMTLEKNDEIYPSQMFSLVTCSYLLNPSNERTVAACHTKILESTTINKIA